MVSAPAFQAGDASHRGFESLLPLHFSRFGRVAQRLAQRAYIPQVVGSNPTPPTILESPSRCMMTCIDERSRSRSCDEL